MQGSITLKGQLTDKLREKCAFGEKRHVAKQIHWQNNVPTVHSFETYETYKKQIKAFADYLKTIKVRKMEDIKPAHVKSYLEHCQARGDSPYSLPTYSAAITKVTGITRAEIGFDFPDRTRKDITRSRGENKSEQKLNMDKYRDVEVLCKACGLRRIEAQSLLYKDIEVTEKEIFINVRNAKGGRPRKNNSEQDLRKSAS